MTINDCMAALVAELAEGEVPRPLDQRFTLAAIWQDLARLAGEELPAEVAAVVEATVGLRIEPVLPPPFARGAEVWLPAD